MLNSNEVWKNIPGFVEDYKISSIGRIFSYPKHGREGQLLTPARTNKNGDLHVVLSRNATPYPKSVRHLLEITFGKEVDIDSVMNKLNEVRKQDDKTSKFVGKPHHKAFEDVLMY
jgi:hypothetical protein